jgi:hypothetical protein
MAMRGEHLMMRLYVLNLLKPTRKHYTISQMNNNSNEDVPNAYPPIQVIEQSDAADASKAAASHLNQSRFHIEVKGEALTATPAGSLSYFEWFIATNPIEIDGGGEDSSEDPVEGAEENGRPESMDNEDEDGSDQIDNLEESGRNIDDEDTPNLHPLKGYEYTTFNPTPNSPATTTYMLHPIQADILAAIEDFKKILHPKHDTRRGYKDPKIDLWHHARLEGMMSMFHMFMNQQSHTYNQWGASACQAAIGMG